MPNKAILLIIDPQVDFCDPSGNLYVKNAEKDIKNISAMINKNLNNIERINITLDSHQYVHIAHPIFWVDSKGTHPNPFTIITVEDVEKGVWKPTNPFMKVSATMTAQEWALKYVKSLKANNRYALCIWPPHCLIGSVGGTVMPELFEATINWEKKFRKVNYVPKGSNIYTENYSVVKADVEFPGDPTTMLNTQLISMLNGDNDILICGEASSHCTCNTIRDIIEEFSIDEVKKLVFLQDASSPVTGFEKLAEDSINEFVAKGMRISTTTKYF